MKKIIEKYKIKLNGWTKISRVIKKVKRKKLENLSWFLMQRKKYSKDKTNNKTINVYGLNSWEYLIKKTLKEIRNINRNLKSLSLNSKDKI